MKDAHIPDETRRRFVRTFFTLPAVFSASALFGLARCDSMTEEEAVLNPTPACADDDDDPTPAQTEGPYCTSNSPERTSLLEAGLGGTLLILSGQVLMTACQPVANALVDFWQANDAGAYDNVGYTLRGHQFTDAEGNYRLETIIPGLYPGRTRHIHVKVQAPDEPIMTTQLYFPGEPQNATDGIFREECLIAITEGDEGQVGVFNFVLDLG